MAQPATQRGLENPQYNLDEEHHREQQDLFGVSGTKVHSGKAISKSGEDPNPIQTPTHPPRNGSARNFKDKNLHFPQSLDQINASIPPGLR